MQQRLIFQPVAALALLTFAVLILIPIRRFAAARAGLVKRSDFTLGESSAVPGPARIPNRNYMNLLELPVLFYVGAIVYEVCGKVDAIALTMAWAYVAFRGLHSAIHLTYNDVTHRLMAFTASNVVLLAFWIRFLVVD